MSRSVPRILIAMPEATYRKMRLAEFEDELRRLGEVTYCLNPRELSEEEYGALWADADAVVTGWGVRPPTEEMLDRAKHLRIVAHTAGSVRMLPRSLLDRGVTVTSARAAIARTVGEFSLMNAMVLLRRLPAHIDPSRAGFYAERARSTNETLFEKTVGLVGYGCVGRWFRELLRPFGCRVLVYDPYLPAGDAAQEDVEPVELGDLLRRSRIVSLHAPDIPQTHGMIGERELGLLQDGAVFLNSARGRIVDTEALTRALATGRFYAAIDVTDPEPLPPDHSLRSLPNVVFTPHVAGPPEDDLPQLTRMALDDLARFLHGEAPLHAISPAAYDIMSF